MSEKSQKTNISLRSFITAIAIILGLMILCYGLTFLIPGGQYARTVTLVNGEEQTVIDKDSFSEVEGGIPFWKWLLSPFLVLGSDNGRTLIAVNLFLLVIGGGFSCLSECGLMSYMLDKITYRFGGSRYKLMAVIVFFFMAMGSLIGSFEECVPLVPIVVALAVSLGWDAFTGFSMSLLSVGCGFAAGVFNPFTVGVAQELAGLKMFSGVWLRALSFVLIYLLLFCFIYFYAKKIEKPLSEVKSNASFVKNRQMDKALLSFVLIIGAGILLTLSSAFIKVLQDYTMIIVALMFLVAGFVAPAVAKMSANKHSKTFLSGILGICPAILMILMASSVKYILEEANILDTLLHYAVEISEIIPPWTVILFIYLIVLIMNFFVASGSAKAFMLIPLIVPLAQIAGISPQLCIVAFAFGDGFSNVLYPTNPVLLISLGLVDMNYGKWLKHSWKFQLANLVLTSLILLLGLAVGY